MDDQERIRNLEAENDALVAAIGVLHIERERAEVALNALANIETIMNASKRTPLTAIRSEIAAARVKIQVLEESQ
mgnify:CR=1 FL=1